IMVPRLQSPWRARVLPGGPVASAEQGSASVEFAASSIVFLMAMIGFMKLCLAIYTYHFVSEAAREGSRYAIVRGTSCSGFGTACPASSGDIKTYVKGLGYPGISTSAMTVTPSWAASPPGK